ncbi:sugar ABC transporter permease [Cohnella sp. LGH]|uniref:Putative aldouronate transport system permease protein n=1 Tax=Cohnella phaseoli TaxID=456490 RepID=A0A3D9JRS1_9BACL|nr:MULTISPECIES: ABC transporter permease subunit [Cohnella]QTH40730.1 sugar ABC transporter permease [Cohnella sp. LGH]RED76821.1 putative aldouronate transport system permease protein [Cohnella phaseoli]
MPARKWRKEGPLHLMLLPSLVLLLMFSYLPMAGIVIAFQKFNPGLGVWRSKWIGWDNFTYLFLLPNFNQVLINTVVIAGMKIIVGILLPLIVSIMLNEVRHKLLKSGIQTIIYLPHFLSWVILAGILIDLLSMKGLVNVFLTRVFDISPIFFLGDNSWFRIVLVLSDAWKEFGFSTIVYLAAITSINPALYESATVDGAGRWKKTLNVTIPGIIPIIVLLTTLSLGNVLNAGFDQVFNLYNTAVYETGDIIDTLIYRTGLVEFKYGLATAVGVFKSVISFIMISISYWLAYRLANYRIF